LLAEDPKDPPRRGTKSLEHHVSVHSHSSLYTPVDHCSADNLNGIATSKFEDLQFLPNVPKITLVGMLKNQDDLLVTLIYLARIGSTPNALRKLGLLMGRFPTGFDGSRYSRV
jgi:hypothetical protein